MKLRLVIGLTLLALALNSAIPQGWMPSGAGGKMLLVLCVGDGTVERWVDLDGDDPQHEDSDHRAPCAFGALQSVALTPEGQPPTQLPQTLIAVWHRTDFTHRSAGFHARYDARGPPLAL